MGINIIDSVFIIIILLLLSAFFSGSEIALFSMDKIKLRTRAGKGDKKAKIIQDFLKEPEKIIGTILVSNNFVNILISSIITTIAIHYFNNYGILIATVFTTILVLIFGEFTPKTFSAQYADKVAYFVSYPMKFLINFLAPVVRIFANFTNFILKFLGTKQTNKNVSFTIEEIKTMIHIGKEEGILGKKEEEMLRSIIDFTDTTVKEIMVPRTDIVAFEINTNYEELIKKIIESEYSRLPIYENNIDNIIGIIYAKDFLSFDSKEKIILKETLHTPYFIPETKKVIQLLQEFKTKKIHMAIVIDEFGGTAGLVTLEDIIEEIVGEIQDEYDVEETKITFLQEGSFIVDAGMSIDDFNEQIKTKLIINESATTIGGFVLELFGKIPKEGEKVEAENFIFEAIQMDKTRLVKIKVHKKEGQKNESNI